MPENLTGITVQTDKEFVEIYVESNQRSFELYPLKPLLLETFAKLGFGDATVTEIPSSCELKLPGITVAWGIKRRSYYTWLIRITRSATNTPTKIAVVVKIFVEQFPELSGVVSFYTKFDADFKCQVTDIGPSGPPISLLQLCQQSPTSPPIPFTRIAHNANIKWWRFSKKVAGLSPTVVYDEFSRKLRLSKTTI